MAIRPISTNTSDLLVDTYDTNLNLPAYSGASTLSVYSILGFSTSQILIIGNLGDESSEIINTHVSTAPTGNTITLASTLKKDHPGDIKISVLYYDQIEFSTATTETGTKVVLNTISIDPEKTETLYQDTTGATGFYFTRYKNSINGNFSDYSDPIPVTGLQSNTVGYIIESAMNESQKEFTQKLTYEVLIREINQCLRYVKGKLKRWSNNESFNKNLGQANRGIYSIALPIDYYDKNSNRSCLDVRIGNQEHLMYVDKSEFDTLMEDVTVSTVTTLGTIGSTTLVVANSADYPSNGSVTVYINNVPQIITYTTNDLTTNTLSGIPSVGTGSITTQIPVGTNVWYMMNEGSVQWFTIYSGMLYWWNPCDETTTGRTIYMDYFTDITEVDSDGDIIPLAKFDMIKHWLKWVIRNITERNGKPDLNDQDFVLFNSILTDAMRRETTGQKFKMLPKVSGIHYRGRSNPNQSYESYQRS